ncbi:MAG: tetratricopeptide repeat protein [Planctomycetes bacterium]|nr:tetratricopeptide repeat protein [Planctomycetota bacterium]
MSGEGSFLTKPIGSRATLTWLALAWLTLAWLTLALTGCGTSSTQTGPVAAPETRPAVSRMTGDKLVAGAVSALSKLDEFDEQRAYEQAFDRLTQWSHMAGSEPPSWRIDPLVANLPERLRSGVESMLEQPGFDAVGDVAFLRDRRWLADIATTARGDATDDLTTATRLFDWTVRSLAIGGDPPMVPTEATPGTRWFLPGEILLTGRASAAQRCWIFVELLRQAGIDAVMLATGDPQAGTLRPWLPAAIIDGEAYLFEPTYGMPVPGPGAAGVATARQAAADPAILDALSLPDRSYPVKAADVGSLAVLAVADPRSLARRMTALDKEAAARHGLRLSVDASAVAAAAAKALPGEVPPVMGLWEFPWESVARRPTPEVELAARRELAPFAITVAEMGRGDRQAQRLVRPLFNARIREFRGDLDGPLGAKAAYLAARPSKVAIQQALQAVPPEQSATVDRLYRQMKEDATYWLGVATLGEGQPAAAIDYLQRMTLENSPDSRWTDAARANLGRAYADLGRIDEAVKVLREDGSPQRFGSRLLAERLEKQPKATAGTPPQ